MAWTSLAAATLAFAIVPDLVRLPEPEGVIVLDRTTYLPGNGEAIEVALPHAIFSMSGHTANVVHYRFEFDLQAVPEKELSIFIPTVNRRIALLFDGESLLEFEADTAWNGALVSAPVMTRLPTRRLIAGRHQLTVLVERGDFAIPAYLSKIYIGRETALMPPYKWLLMIESHLKNIALAVHVVLGLGLILIYFFRPKDSLFAWIASLNIVSLIVAIGVHIGWQPALQGILPFINSLLPALGFLFLGFTLAVIDVPPSKFLRYAAIAVPFTVLPIALIDTTLARLIVGGLGVIVLISSYVISTGILAWAAFRWRNADARLILPAVFLLAWFALRDVYVTVTAPEHGFNLLVPFARPMLLAFVAAMLMRRMGISLDRLDSANETLNIKLAEREAELAILSRQERVEATRLTREQERQRLTHDLHDGLSGHLVSIIALSERAGDKPTEQAAREALNDLRLVIYSLDLGDRELPLALANFRERLIPQLHRLGVELDWSIASLPEVSGVTPGNALAVLRILQEAITNALKHGPARRIAIRGALAADGMVAITVDNDGRPFVEAAHGHGLRNMRRRAQQLNGQLTIASHERGVRLTLLLPPSLPDFEDETAG